MTKSETDFRSLVEQYTLREYGYSVYDLKPESGGVYTLKLKRLGDLDEIPFPVFADQIRDAASKGQLPVGLLRSFTDDRRLSAAKTARSI